MIGGLLRKLMELLNNSLSLSLYSINLILCGAINSIYFLHEIFSTGMDWTAKRQDKTRGEIDRGAGGGEEVKLINIAIHLCARML